MCSCQSLLKVLLCCFCFSDKFFHDLTSAVPPFSPSALLPTIEFWSERIHDSFKTLEVYFHMLLPSPICHRCLSNSYLFFRAHLECHLLQETLHNNSKSDCEHYPPSFSEPFFLILSWHSSQSTVVTGVHTQVPW